MAATIALGGCSAASTSNVRAGSLRDTATLPISARSGVRREEAAAENQSGKIVRSYATLCHNSLVDAFKTLLEIVGMVWTWITSVFGLLGILLIVMFVVGWENPTSAAAGIAEWAGADPAQVRPVTDGIHAWMTAPSRFEIIGWSAAILAAVLALNFVLASRASRVAQHEEQSSANHVIFADRERYLRSGDHSGFARGRLTEEEANHLYESARKEHSKVWERTRERQSEMFAQRMVLACLAWLPVAVSFELKGWVSNAFLTIGAATLLALLILHFWAADEFPTRPDLPERTWKKRFYSIVGGLIEVVISVGLSLIALPTRIYLKLTRS